jgi:CheY-like chemotaxis protein
MGEVDAGSVTGGDAGGRWGRVRTVLVVDDEPDVRLIARLVLGAAGYEVLEAASGEEALDVLETTVPDVVLLDVRMPGIDGWTVHERIRSRVGTDALPVVFFTADLAARSEAPAEIGEAQLLTKPFQADDLLWAIRSVL